MAAHRAQIIEERALLKPHAEALAGNLEDARVCHGQSRRTGQGRRPIVALTWFANLLNARFDGDLKRARHQRRQGGQTLWHPVCSTATSSRGGSASLTFAPVVGDSSHAEPAAPQLRDRAKHERPRAQGPLHGPAQAGRVRGRWRGVHRRRT
jgi:hypothetical protein